jgi:hypothetical protein
MNEYVFPSGIRQVIVDALPKDTAVFETPDIRYTFTPASHNRALHPDVMLVEGIRGAGKSFWWSVLQSPDHRRMVAHMLPKTGIDEKTKVSVGFGERPSPDEYPGKDTLVELILIHRFDARQIWRSVVLRQIIKGPDKQFAVPVSTWKETVEWVTGNPELVERIFFNSDRQLDQDGKYHLILFDALDRTADDWPIMLKIIRGLLQVLLEFRSYKRIRPKAFLRPDHLKDARVAEFPDSSKVLNQKVELRWPRNDLYGLLWQYFSNEPDNGKMFRDGCSQIIGVTWDKYSDIWMVPEKLRNDDLTQREVFHSITGPWMGRYRRRGLPYTWLPNHLGDVTGQVSPRSFLAAIRHAASDSPRKDYIYPLYYESIKKGVQEASRIRVREMQEDYPWVENLMKPLAGLKVPCRFDEIAQRWDEQRVLESIRRDIIQATHKLPPSHLDEGSQGVRNDLDDLGVFERLTDDRVNLPDVYRLGYNMPRKGGVRLTVTDSMR